MTSEYQDSWPEAMGLLSHPNAAGDAFKLLGQLVDDIWYCAGDKSHDMNWYTKRGSLAFIYKVILLNLFVIIIIIIILMVMIIIIVVITVTP